MEMPAISRPIGRENPGSSKAIRKVVERDHHGWRLDDGGMNQRPCGKGACESIKDDQKAAQQRDPGTRGTHTEKTQLADGNGCEESEADNCAKLQK